MSDTAPFTVPDGYYPPFAIISDSDHGGWIIIATSLGLAMALLSTIIRIYVKSILRQQLSLDDILLAGATLFAWLTETIILQACARGLGRQVNLLSPASLRHVEKSFYSSQLLTIVALGFCKCSVACFIIRLTPKTSMKRIMQGILVCSVAWTVASIFALALQCDLASPWSYASGSCNGVWQRVLSIGIVDIILELALFIAAILLVSSLHTALHKKAIVVLAFGMRLPIVGFIAARLATFDRTDLTNFALSESLYIVWTVTQINYSLVSTTLPILRPFIKDLATFYGAMRPSEYSGNTRSRSYPLSSLKSKHSNPPNGSAGAPRQQSIAKDRLDTFDFAVSRYPAVATSTHCEAEVQGRPSRPSEEPEMSTHSLGSDDSQRMIIQVQNQVTVESRDVRL
ncbi:hypothetical protein CLAFUW4_01502 [Fulvia fulva]|uniref:Rhodopsin domain-containing protein n=1 Tax=Passalora fulva TaxID=5499 RepID=A0A9Q8P2V2_PASFU|nr:uncharacterized protein CLAFUR5_01504 [Fulvia fulva]KAK4634790.1 hypothetical protein CLAFUR4_01503 [Fulvia fulva]KAK4637891.1 hypothetical protein CLAFUR0_01504 [Fulvia fulva]UJO11144.1 hypothetical protein CLAFUR5_01504 [Fulvia fulva]WPV09755.1 hypothetical protein CLAFUW4_01502 [Fulvia fulva]WPV23432.1 hypothetical protein CLAFUW7_01507 [Fulvia fulva]